MNNIHMKGQIKFILHPLQKPITKEIDIPGSKSYTNRALLLAAMTQHSVKITNPLFSDDTKAMINCLKKLGIEMILKKDSIEVTNDISSVKNHLYNLEADLSGTTLRFILALCTIIPGVKVLHGKEGLTNRPIEELVRGLRQLGAKISYMGKNGYPPLHVFSSKLSEGTVKINGTISSQYVSALLMIAPLVGKVVIEVTGEQVSKPYIDMTIDSMKQFGIKVINQGYKKYIVPTGQKYNTEKYPVEDDVSSASYFFAIAALTESTITVKNINPNSVQGDMKFLKILEKMGNEIVYGNNWIKMIGKGVKPVNVDMEDCPDQVQTLAVLAAFANGVTKISGIQSLHIKETDRVKAITAELLKMGIKTRVSGNHLEIFGNNPLPAEISTYNDHRMAMAFAVAGAKLEGITIDNPDVVTKTFPDFWEKLKKIGVKIS